MEWIKSVFLALSLSHPKASGELKPSGKCLLQATLCYCWKYLSLNIEKNETIFYPPAILGSICVACWGSPLAMQHPSPANAELLTHHAGEVSRTESDPIHLLRVPLKRPERAGRWSSYRTRRNTRRLPSHSRSQQQAGRSTLPAQTEEMLLLNSLSPFFMQGKLQVR